MSEGLFERYNVDMLNYGLPETLKIMLLFTSIGFPLFGVPVG